MNRSVGNWTSEPLFSPWNKKMPNVIHISSEAIADLTELDCLQLSIATVASKCQSTNVSWIAGCVYECLNVYVSCVCLCACRMNVSADTVNE